MVRGLRGNANGDREQVTGGRTKTPRRRATSKRRVYRERAGGKAERPRAGGGGVVETERDRKPTGEGIPIGA